MSEKKKEQKKIYIAIGLALIMVVLCYFRFIHKKGTGISDKNKSPNYLPVAELDVPEVNIEMLKTVNWSKQQQGGPLPILKRDIFVNVKNKFIISSPESTERGRGAIKSPQIASGLKLTGTVVGGKNPIAIINDQFVRVGDLIDEYTLVSIGKKEVILNMDDRIVKVGMLKNE
jgi:hypothetical protein